MRNKISVFQLWFLKSSPYHIFNKTSAVLDNTRSVTLNSLDELLDDTEKKYVELLQNLRIKFTDRHIFIKKFK